MKTRVATSIKGSRRLFLIGWTALVLIVAVILVFGLGIFSDFKSLTFENGTGSKYKLSFYKNYSVKLANDGLQASSLAPGLQDSKAKKLVSKIGRDSKAPLALIVSRVPAANSQLISQNYKSCPSSTTKSMTVHNKATGNDVNLCALKSDDKDIIYIGFLKDAKGFDVILFTQDVNYTAVTDTKSAEQLLKKIGLSVYKQDITKIVASIKPL